ncbi:MAG: hypothetical protein ACE5GX_15280 [Thermoanaerobaculia bacterium]
MTRLSFRSPNWCRAAAAFLLLPIVMTHPATAQGDSADTAVNQIEALRAEMNALRSDYEKRIGELEARLAELETAASEDPRLAESDELASLREAARELAAETSTTTPPAEPSSATAPAAGRAGDLNRLNPEVSFTGILVGATLGERRDEFTFEEFELDLQSALDPFSRTRVTLAVGEEGLEVEEAYVNYSSLPGGLDLLAGKFRQRFGPLNRQHLHALPQTEYPLVYQILFGEEGLGQTGLSFTWLLPKPWAEANEVTLEITDGENEEAFAGEEFEDFAVLGRLKNFWELSDGYFEWGLSGIAGRTADGGDSRIYGTDFTYNWQPPGKSKYRGLTWRTELLVSERDDDLGVQQDAVGGYTYLEGLFKRNLYAGVRFDRVEDPLDPSSYTTGIVPYLTWWQSEYVRLRAEYGLFELEPSGESDDRFSFQLTWAAGPHKHESY